MTSRKQLLFLSPIVPARGGNGLAMRTWFFLEAYARRFDIDLAVFPVAGASRGPDRLLLDRTARLNVFPLPPVNTHFSLIARMEDFDARLSAFRNYGQPSLASRSGVAARETLAEWVHDRVYDAVHVERLYLAPLAERWTSMPPERPTRLIIDCDDDDAKAYCRLATMARNDGRPHAAAWADAEAEAFACMAQRVLPRFDLVSAASLNDATSLSTDTVSVTVIPNVVPADITPGRKRRPGRARTILFVGNFGYPPNVEGARWFLKRIWPRLRRKSRSSLRLVLAGNQPPVALVRLGRQRDVRVMASVPDIASCYRLADIAVVPIRSGGGTRIKLIEAAAYGLPIVSTTIGAEGTTFRHGRDLLLADTEERFVQACAGLLAHPICARQLARRARATASRDYDRDRWASRLANWTSDPRVG